MKKLIFGRKVQQPQPQQPTTTPSGKLLRKPTIDSVDSSGGATRRVVQQQQTQTQQIQPQQVPPPSQPQHQATTRSLPLVPAPPLSRPSLPSHPPPPPPTEGRQDSVSSHHTASAQRASFQLQRNSGIPSTPTPRKSSQESSADASWIVVAATPNGLATAPGTVQTDSTGTILTATTADPLFVRAQPSFESRSSSLASLPPGASPPIAYPPPSPYNNSSDAAPPPPPPQQAHPQSRSKPPRKSSSDQHHHHQQSNDNLSMASHPEAAKELAKHHDKPKRGLFDWLGGEREKEKIARERTRPGMSLGPDGQPWDLTRMMGASLACISVRLEGSR